ncbi:hypothetical protein F2Q70_00029288 [Brassica cretica]|uniref:F-box domain-containing protein n=1 Tax=Brassica cretica TaxID=69181 RepID=A0A8S9FCB2_BRACR|nr:hypothetical protein F2Q70_00029288 [Brassica cretica]KAF3594644.1 hypothetical protein DY000_02020677 [Brassica cretica]
MINNLPDDLLVQILLHVPIKDAVSTMILSKRWRSIWTMLPALDYDDSDIDGESKSIWKMDCKCCLSQNTGTNIYTQLACLPSLTRLWLLSVVFKDEDSLVGLLSSCPILRNLYVIRRNEDNVTNFNVKISFLETLVYVNEYKEDFEDSNGSFVINSPTLKTAIICDYSGDSFLIENKCFLDKASIKVLNHLGDDIRIFISSLIRLDVLLNNPTVGCFTTINFSQLIERRIQPYEFDRLKPLMILVQNSPKLKVLLVDVMDQDDDFPISWHHPGSVPKCLLTNLEIFEWKEYGGKFEEKELVKYIFANSRFLKRAAISIRSKCILEGKEKTMVDELKSMPRISESHALMFETVIDWRDIYRKGFNAAMW